ncbi:hypothetical protein EYF80_008897 [Liparis tanakae]|uniref:Uncharacterized protein n=1 Tax=Liparis tanakae TaxID=230148 RepID=A0A4Z2IUA8_9TELE|nr:hypothetical protein EYF80_008897 [Liparis tanakae]
MGPQVLKGKMSGHGAGRPVGEPGRPNSGPSALLSLSLSAEYAEFGDTSTWRQLISTVFMESGEEQHFLRGKPAFRTQTLFQALQTGNVLSPIYVFHPVPRKHEC